MKIHLPSSEPVVFVVEPGARGYAVPPVTRERLDRAEAIPLGEVSPGQEGELASDAYERRVRVLEILCEGSGRLRDDETIDTSEPLPVRSLDSVGENHLLTVLTLQGYGMDFEAGGVVQIAAIKAEIARRALRAMAPETQPEGGN